MAKANIKLPHIRFLLFLSSFIAVALVFGVWTQAQQAGQGLEVSPPSQEVKVDPGDSILLKTSIRNKSNRSLPIKARLEDFVAMGDQGQVELVSDSKYSLKSWSSLSAKEFTLAPGESRSVTAAISVPADAAGGRYGSFVFGIAGDKKPGSAALSQEIASLFLLRISGPVDETLSLLSFSAPAFSEFGPIPFSAKIKNSGNIHTKVYGLINVTDMFGNKVKDVIVYETNIFPGASREVMATLDNKFLLGKYTATAVVYYGTEKNQTLTSSLTFYVFPLKAALIIAAVLVVLYFGRKRLGKALSALFGK